MRRTCGSSIVAVALVACGLVVAGLAAAGERSKSAGDRFWVAPDVAGYPVTSVALLPPATYDGNVDARKMVETAVGQALRASGHRWVSPFLVRDYLLRAGGD